MKIDRPFLLNRLVRAKHDGFVKVLTGIRRCGKSYLLFSLFRDHLLDSGVSADHILAIDLERDENEGLRRPDRLGNYIREHLVHDGTWNYVLIDEIQMCKPVLPDGVDLSRFRPEDRDDCYLTFYSVLSGLKNTPFIDVYVTGSNSKLLSSDVATEFRGRGEAIHVTPLSFAEFQPLRAGNPNPFAALQEYMTYGGLPECVLKETQAEREDYLKALYETIYLRDLESRNHLRNGDLLALIVDITMSDIGCATNPTRLTNRLRTVHGCTASRMTVTSYLDCLEDAFLISKADRFDVKGGRYLDYPCKYYATDPGLRNARINFRQFETTHLMENVIYNELLRRGYSVDIGVVEINSHASGKHELRRYEIDFVVNRGYERIYIQSAWMIPDEEKMAQETFSLKHTGDNFRKVVIDGSPMAVKHIDNDGIGHIGLLDFLLDPKSIEML